MVSYYRGVEGQIVEVSNQEESTWINVFPPFEIAELEELAEVNNIPYDYLKDSVDIDEMSRYEVDDDVKLIVLNTAILSKEMQSKEAIYITAPLGIVFFQNKILTICRFSNPIIENIIKGRVKNLDINDLKYFVLKIMDSNVQRFFRCLKKLNLKRNLIEEELYNSSKSEELIQLLSIEKSFVFFVNAINSNDLLKLKMKRTDFLGIRNIELHYDYFEDIIIDNSQILNMATVYTNILNGTMEAYASIISNNLSEFVNRLTLVTIVLAVPTLISSFYGMNVKGLPFAENPFAFFYVLFFSIIVILVILGLFRRYNKF